MQVNFEFDHGPMIFDRVISFEEIFSFRSLTFVWMYNWLFMVLRPAHFFFIIIWRRHHCRWRDAKFSPMLGAQGLCAGRVFIVPHLLWHGTSIFPVSSEGPPHSVASYDTWGEVEDLFLPGSSRDCTGLKLHVEIRHRNAKVKFEFDYGLLIFDSYQPWTYKKVCNFQFPFFNFWRDVCIRLKLQV
jgi:hypothetical protein